MEKEINAILNDLFLSTGEIGYRLLQNAIINPELENEIQDDQDLEA